MRTLRILVSPRLLALHAAGLLVVAATVWLGMWQYGVWNEHRTESARDLANAAPRPVTEVLGDSGRFPNNAVGVPVTLSGSWRSADTFYVSGREEDGRAGYWMVTPLTCSGGELRCGTPSTLVVVGFTETTTGAAPTGEADVTGWLQPSDSQFVADENPADNVLPALRIPSAAQRIDVPLEPGYVVAKSITPPTPPGLSPVNPESLPKPPPTTALRNLLYGMQWWVFGGFAVFMWWRWSADAVVAARSTGQPQDAPDPAVPSGA